MDRPPAWSGVLQEGRGAHRSEQTEGSWGQRASRRGRVLGVSLARREQGTFEDLRVDPDGGARRSVGGVEVTLNKRDFFSLLSFYSLAFPLPKHSLLEHSAEYSSNFLITVK